MTQTMHNWAGNIAYSAKRVHEPTLVTEVQDMVARAHKVRALGSRHSFNTIADSDDTLIVMHGLDHVLEIDTERATVRAGGGITYGQLCPVLDDAGFALANLASLPHISVAGAVSTATHGSGVRNRNLASQICGLTLVDAQGDLIDLDRGDEDFPGAVIGLGALGIVTEVRLDLEPRFGVSQSVFLDLPIHAAKSDFDAIMSSAYSVSLFTDWRGDTINQVWTKALEDDGTPDIGRFGARPALGAMNPVPGMDGVNCTGQMGVPGPWHERLPHFRLDFTPSAGDELQSEYFVPYADAGAAIAALEAIADLIAPHLLISEIRTIAADDLWMSPCFGTDSVAFHFTWKPDWMRVRAVLPEIEAALAPFGVIPHLGKLFVLPRDELRRRYARIDDFRDLAVRYDPGGKFRNGFIEDLLY